MNRFCSDFCKFHVFQIRISKHFYKFAYYIVLQESRSYFRMQWHINDNSNWVENEITQCVVKY